LPSPYAKGVSSFSPGLVGPPTYPGFVANQAAYPERVAAIQRTIDGTPLGYEVTVEC
jgi:hypothetical protein